MPYADNDGVFLSYEVGGRGDADPVVFVEGLGYGRWMWRWQRTQVESAYRVVVWDNRGTGDSDAPDGPYSIEEMASDLEAILNDLDIESAHVVGASMGGMVAQRFALDFDRARSLTLLCTSPGGDDAVPVPPETQARMFDVPEEYDEREAIRYKMAPAMTAEFAEENDDLLADIVDWRLANDASDEARQAQVAAVADFDVGDRLAEIDVPVLVAHGTDDRVLPVENARILHDRLPNVELALFDGGPHLFFIEQSDAVNERILGFLDDV
ncbi:alpha/beta fold hydrolase [Haladaptatus sp. NG-SE-30]